MDYMDVFKISSALDLVIRLFRSLAEEYQREMPDNSFVNRVECMISWAGLWDVYRDYMAGEGIVIDG